DTGIDYGHADFGSCTLAQINDGDPSTCPKIVGGWDFLNNDNDPIDKDPCTVAEKSAALSEPDRKSCPVENGLYGGHGTHVASTIAGNGVLKGVAPDAKLIVFKTLGGVKGGGSSVGRIKALGCATGVLSNVGDIVIKYAGLSNSPSMSEIIFNISECISKTHFLVESALLRCAIRLLT
ncbi:S8 family serine peptidase, partial [Candidatus Woesearchaeota archaeon]|nr:S8 family serine peptidase [Candidatus Woesearchaeota archaeon]